MRAKLILKKIHHWPSFISPSRILLPAVLYFISTPAAWAEEKIAVFPTAPYDVYIIYECLAAFWLIIIGLVVIIKMKLWEIERIQKLGIDKVDEKAPQLD